MYRIGSGIDIHPFKEGRKLILAGVEIPHSKGLDGHSDADVVLHAVSDALLGAASLGDLGDHFPGDAKNKDRKSSEILAEVVELIRAKGFEVENIDVNLLMEAPKVAPYRLQMRKNIAEVLGVLPECVGLKATTCEGLGFVGRQEGVLATAQVLLRKGKL